MVATQAAQAVMEDRDAEAAAAAAAREQKQPLSSKQLQQDQVVGGGGSSGVGKEGSGVSLTNDDGSYTAGGGDGAGFAQQQQVLLPDLETKAKESLDGDHFMRTMDELLKINGKLTIQLIDFGGQRVFGAVHGLFMNKYGLYVLCFSMVSWLADQQQCEKDIKMWVNSVVVYTGTVNADRDLQPAPILIVGTHKDQVADVADHRRMSESIKALFGDQHPVWKNLHENDAQKLVFFPVDNTQGE